MCLGMEGVFSATDPIEGHIEKKAIAQNQNGFNNQH